MDRGEFASWLKRDYYAGEWQVSGGDEWHMGKMPELNMTGWIEH